MLLKRSRITTTINLATKTESVCKVPGGNEASKDTLSEAKCGEAAVTTGFLGGGKLMSSWRVMSSEISDGGLSLPGDSVAVMDVGLGVAHVKGDAFK